MGSATENNPKTLDGRDAAEAIRHALPVVLPTETVFGIGADASSPKALDRLWSIGKGSHRQPLAWHIGSTAVLHSALDDLQHTLSPVQNRLVGQLCPGPMLLAIEMDSQTLERFQKQFGIAPGVVDEGGALLVRVVANRETQNTLDLAGVPVVLRAIPAAGSPRTTDEAVRAIERIDTNETVAGVLASDQRALGQSSTLVRFLKSGSYRVDREGAYSQRYIDKQIMRTILFVCTGNTCRSPMAAAIARELIERSPLDLPTTVRSAGAFTSGGMPATPEAVHAVESLGYAMGPHQSSVLTREMINQADEVYGLTASHVEAIRAIDPTAGDKIMLLDPDGRDVPDPIGQSQSVYDETAKRLQELIQRRLSEHRQTVPGEGPQ
ncbi:MAG: Sua5/YciO/YrdC/YwlC family protein [Phycisphaerales bacterium JB065]